MYLPCLTSGRFAHTIPRYRGIQNPASIAPGGLSASTFRRSMAITPEQIGEAVVKAIPGFFNDAIDQLRQGEGAYIRDGMPEGIVAQIGQAVARSACRQYGQDGPEAAGGRAERFERACRPYLDTLSPGDGATFRVPYPGGQCANGYRVVPTRQINSGAVTVLPTRFLLGPLGATRVSSSSPGTFLFEMFAQGELAVADTGCGPVIGTEAKFYQLGEVVTGINNKVRYAIQSVTACPGGANNCGDPAPIVEPPFRIPDTTPPPFRFNPGPGIDIPVNVDINPDGTINVDFGDGPVTVDPFEEDGGGAGGAGGDPGDPTDPGSPGAGGDTGGGGDADGEAPPGQELVGVLVEVLSSPENANTYANNVANVFRGIGYIRMGYPGRLGADISASVVASPQFFHAQQRGLTNWETRANIGFNLRTTPYYREIT